MASSSTKFEHQNEKGHVKFLPLPQSETQTHDINDDHLEDQSLSISVESTTTRTINIPDYYFPEEILNNRSQTCEIAQDLLGFIVLILLIFLPLYLRHLGSPHEDPIPPIVTLNSMYIYNFTTGKEGLGATWDAKFTITNANVSSIYFRKVDFTIFYKQNPEHVLSFASSYPFYLDQEEDMKLHVNFTTGLEDYELFVENELVEEIGKDKDKDGSLSFGMKMKIQAIYYGETWVSDVTMTPYCEDLRVQFFTSKDSGRLTNPNRNFSVPIEWKPFSFF
ncbi:unnamed protein product [Lupinus luteus]|uniref:Late embryogenesis abundant protein LEA-2 subgroup domain-containing protein n=1 Tax=Lupinus luteus TaxID=3873 RepID=A0AAV1XYL8_LUPLU